MKPLEENCIMESLGSHNLNLKVHFNLTNSDRNRPVCVLLLSTTYSFKMKQNTNLIKPPDLSFILRSNLQRVCDKSMTWGEQL